VHLRQILSWQQFGSRLSLIASTLFPVDKAWERYQVTYSVDEDKLKYSRAFSSFIPQSYLAFVTFVRFGSFDLKITLKFGAG
jgi:hypothetical protein